MTAALAVAILVACLAPRLEVPAPSGLEIDKVLHFLAFAALAFAWRRAGGGRPTVLVAAATLAALTEVGQALFVPGRHGSLLDVAADLAGALAGALVSDDPAGRGAREAVRRPGSSRRGRGAR